MTPPLALILVFVLLLAAISVASLNVFNDFAREQNEKKEAENEFKRRKAAMTGKETLGPVARFKQKLLYNLDIIHMPRQIFLIMELGATIIGFFIGKIILTGTELAVFMSVLFAALPLTFIFVRSSWYKQHEMAMLENCMVTITSTYRANKDIIKSVSENINKTNMPVAFKNFLGEVAYVDSSVERALRKVGASFDNKYFDEWIEVLIKSQRDSNMMDILPVIIDEMDEAKKAQNESSAAMRSVWREYVIWVVTCVCVPLVLRLNADWYNALVNTPIGKALVIGLLVFLANTLRAMVKISRESATIM